MKRKYIVPVADRIYTNHNGEQYYCISVETVNQFWETTAVFLRVSDGWKLQAHGIVQYEDGTIEWNYSTGGHWSR